MKNNKTQSRIKDGFSVTKSKKPAGFRRFSPVLLAGTILSLAGCASVHEKSLRNHYNTAYGSAQETTGGGNSKILFNENSSFQDYLQYGLDHNRRLRAAAEKWKAALERIPQARALNDPILSFEYFIEQKDTRYKAGVVQTFPAFGKLGLRESAATAETEAAMHNFESERFMFYERLAKTFYNYYYLSRSIAVTEENLRLLTDMEETVNARYRSGATPFADLIKVQVEREKLADMLNALLDQRRPQSAALAALLDLQLDAPLPWPEFTSSGPAILDEKILADMLADLNPELKSADSMVEAAEYRKKLARRNYLPDLMLGVGWMVMSGMDGSGDESDIGLMAGINLPLWQGRIRGGIREASAAARAADHDRAEAYNRLQSELETEIFKFRDAERRHKLFTTSLVPKAREALAVAKQDYASGNTGFMTLIDAQRTLLEFELMSERAAVDREIALVDIGCCVGQYDIKTDEKNGQKKEE